MENFIQGLPKAELHLHIEGSLEPELMFTIAERNAISLPFASINEVRQAYDFADLQSFLDIYYQGAKVLLYEQDFYDMTLAYFEKARQDNIRHAEIFFDPQTHTDRGVPFHTVITGIARAQQDAQQQWGISSLLIMCFLRHLSAEAAMQTLEAALPYKKQIIGVGLDSSERDYPPEIFAEVFQRATAEGFLTVAHAGEEGPADYIWQALNQLNVARIDHGVRCWEDPTLVAHLVKTGIPLTVCPLSNVKLRVFNDLKQHNLKKLLDAGLRVTINSDDPAYFGGYINENYLATQQALDLTKDEMIVIAQNSIHASFLNEADKQQLLDHIDGYVKAFVD